MRSPRASDPAEQASAGSPERVVDVATAAAFVRAAHAEGSRVVLANGCFDLLHVGHVRYLEGARALGDALVVGINSDRSVRALKGSARPLLDQGARGALVAALEVVDRVVVFDDDDVRQLLRELRPDIHAKGTDYTVDTVPERAEALALGIETAIAGDPKDHSTQALLAQLGADPASAPPDR